MALNKYGSPAKIKVVKQSGFSMGVNHLAEIILKQIPEKTISADQLHSVVKSLGVVNYAAEDMSELMARLQAIGFKIQG